MSNPYMHIPQSLVHPLLHTHRIEESSGTSSAGHRKHLEKKNNKTNQNKHYKELKLVFYKFNHQIIA